MTQFLATGEQPEGFKLEEILKIIRGELIKRTGLLVDDDRLEAAQVMENNLQILTRLSDCIRMAEHSSRLLNKSFGPHQDGVPRIGQG